jgi:ADP-dependent phosphofructokinase/glucokinase
VTASDRDRLPKDVDAFADPTRTVLGLGGTVDYELTWDAETLSTLAIGHDIRSAELDTATRVCDERSLVVSILSHIVERKGGEHFVDSPRAIEQFASHFPVKVTLGGTCVRAALAMTSRGVASTLHLVSIDDRTRRLLPAGCRYICSADRDSYYPHLIVQLPPNGVIPIVDGEIRIAGADRLIFVNDPPHREMRISSELATVLRSADLFLISGFNSMRDPALLRDRVRALLEDMRALPEGATVMYEDAGYHVDGLNRIVWEMLGPRLDVYSMNEDEAQAHLGHRFDPLDATETSHAIAELRALFPGPTLVLHTRAWVLAAGPDADACTAALEGGLQAASERYLCGDVITDDARISLRTITSPPEYQHLARRIEEICVDSVRCRPAYRLSTATPTTIGLGDTFVGGFIAAMQKKRLARSAEAEPGTGATTGRD